MNREDLMKLHDGELDPEITRAARELAESDPHARAELASYQTLGDLVRQAHRQRVREVDLTDAIVARVAASADAPRVGIRQGIGASRRPARTERAARSWPRLAAAAGALAAAAVFALFLSRNAPSPAPASLGVASKPAVTPVPSVPGAEQAPDEHVGVAIESVDFGPTQGAIFLVSAGDSETTVVWTLEDGNDKG